LRDTTGCGRLVAIGIGLGGMLAYAAAAAGAPIDDLILWAVPARGRALLRGLQAHSDIVASRYPEDSRASSLPAGARQLMGFLLSAETANALETLELTALTLPPLTDRRVLMVGRDGLKVDARLRAQLEAAGASIEVANGTDYSRLMAPPETAEIPLATIEKTISWLHSGSRVPPAAAPDAVRRPVRVRDSIRLSRDGTTICERPMRFVLERGEQLGVLCEPVDCAPAHLCAVLPSVGVNRFWVETARSWAARGVPTVRIELEHVGNSDEPPSVSSMYSPERVAETRAVLDQLQAHDLPDRFVLAGLCAAAYWALHTALSDPRVRGLLLINLYCFHWDDALRTEHHTRILRDALRHDAWIRLLQRDVSARQLTKAARVLLSSVVQSGTLRTAALTRSQPVDGALDRLREQGTETLLLLSGGEALYDQFEREQLIDRLELWPNLRLEQIPSRDHLFNALWLRSYVRDRLDCALDRVLTSGALQLQPDKPSPSPI
jgi:pimeloyl-ACP methyl ester carboxylesterase